MMNGLDLLTCLALDTFFNDLRSKSKKSIKCNGSCQKESKKSPKLQPNMSTLIPAIDKIVVNEEKKKVSIFWNEPTENKSMYSVTSVKATENEAFDIEKGIALAIVKHTYGNRYYRDLLKILDTKMEVINPVKKVVESVSTGSTSTAKKSTSTKKSTSKKTSTTKKSTTSKSTAKKSTSTTKSTAKKSSTTKKSTSTKKN